MCIYCGSEDDELVLDTERSSEGKHLCPQCQSCVESGKPCAFDEGTGRNVHEHDSGGVGYHDGEDECDSNTNDDEEQENENDDDNIDCCVDFPLFPFQSP
jgi:hypothetical protein